jgi:hypothetical protein
VVPVIIVVGVFVPVARWCGWSPAEIVALVAAVGALRGAVQTATPQSTHLRQRREA